MCLQYFNSKRLWLNNLQACSKTMKQAVRLQAFAGLGKNVADMSRPLERAKVLLRR